MPNRKDYTFTEDENTARLQEEYLQPSTFETIDQAMMDWLDQEANIFCTTSDGWKKVPVVWVSGERAFQAKNSKELRDADGTLKMPIITLHRTTVVKDLNNQGVFQGAAPYNFDAQRGGRIVVSRRIKQDKTSNFLNASSKRKATDSGHNQINFPSKKKKRKIVYETISIPTPVYITISYGITLRAEYQQQINEMTAPFVTLGGHINAFIIKRDGHRYETFVDSGFSQDHNVTAMNVDERLFQTSLSVRVLGYIMGEDANQERPKIIRTENAVEVKIPREHVIVGDIPQHVDKRGFYRD